MKKNSTILLFSLLIFVSGLSQAQLIKNPNGFQLRSGVNIALWLSQTERRGLERQQYMTENDFGKIASMGFDHVRLPIDEVQLWDDKGAKYADAFTLMHNAIKWSLDRKMRVIVDLHIIRSHYFNATTKPLWTDPKEQDKLVGLWKQLSEELRQYPADWVAYELLNEAVADTPEEWNNLVGRLVKSIRTSEPKRTIVIGSNRWQDVETFPTLKVPANDPNMILSFHYYRPFGLTHYRAPWMDLKEYKGPVHYPGQVVADEELKTVSKDILGKIQWAFGNWDKQRISKDIDIAVGQARKLGLPLFCGEFGVYYLSPEADALRWYSDMASIFKEKNIAFCHWEYKGEFLLVDKNLKPLQPLVDILAK